MTGTLTVAVWNLVNPGSTGAAKTVKLEFKGVSPNAHVAIRRVDAEHGDTLGLMAENGQPAIPNAEPARRSEAAIAAPRP